jgi:hypothetical protein
VTATVTSAGSLAGQVTGSLASTASLACDLGRWLAIVVLLAAFAVASLLTLATVAQRVREFSTLKALGWRSRRIIAQVLGRGRPRRCRRLDHRDCAYPVRDSERHLRQQPERGRGADLDSR